MPLDRRLKCETPITEPRDGILLAIIVRTAIGCAGLSAIVVFLQHF